MPMPLPGDGRPVLTLDELLQALTEARALGGPALGSSPVWIDGVPPFRLPVANVLVVPEGVPRTLVTVLT